MKHQNQSNKWNHAIQNTKCPAKLFIIYNSPVKTMTWILMKIPCHFSSQIYGCLSSKLTPSSMTIPCHLPGFYLCFTLKHDMDFGKVQVMEFPCHLLRKWWDFHGISCRFQPDSRQKDMRKSVSHFLQDDCNSIINN